jgi:hypothetical protein
MARQKKQEATQAQSIPSKKSAKGKKGSLHLDDAKEQLAKLQTATAPAKKASKKAAKPKSDVPMRTNVKHPPVSEETIMKAFDGNRTMLSKKQLVEACGGDEVAVTKAVNRLRGLGKVTVQGSTRSAVYSKAA